jgi:hypothetical protein
VENRTKIFAWCVDWKLGRGQIYGKLVSSLKFSHMCLFVSKTITTKYNHDMIKYGEMFNFGPKLLLGAKKSCKKGFQEW